MQMDVLEMDTVAAGSVRFGKPDEDGGPSGGVGVMEIPAVAPSRGDVERGEHVLSHSVLWLGRAYDGLPLSSLSIDSATAERGGRSVDARIVHVQYGKRLSLPDVSIEEMNLRKERGYLAAVEDVIPPVGLCRPNGPSTSYDGSEEVPLWRGALRRSGLYITIEARSRQQVLDVARALKPAAR